MLEALQSPKPAIWFPLNQFTQDYIVPMLCSKNLRVANPSYFSIGSVIVRERPSSAVSCGVYFTPCSNCILG